MTRHHARNAEVPRCARRRPPGGAGARAGARRCDRAVAVSPRRLEHGGIDGGGLPRDVDRRRAGLRARREPPRRAVRRPRIGYRPVRRGGPARRSRGHRHDADERGPLGRSGEPAGVGRARGAQPRPVTPRRARRSALRTRPEQPADVLHRRQRGQQLGRTALSRRRRHGVARVRDRGRVAGRDRHRARR